jgi:hypothetical protein
VVVNLNVDSKVCRSGVDIGRRSANQNRDDMLRNWIIGNCLGGAYSTYAFYFLFFTLILLYLLTFYFLTQMRNMQSYSSSGAKLMSVCGEFQFY